jgi:NADPH2:quinone reductase
MLAIEISSYGGPEVLKLAERPMPTVEPDEVLIRVEAAGVSRADLMQRKGKYMPPAGASDILGLDVAGTVWDVGSRVQGWKKGDRVCALLSGGGYAEYCSVPAVQVLPIPQGWSAAEATTLPENLFTVYDNLVTRARLKSGDSVLVHGGTSGIGSMAIMVAKAIGAKPYATAGTEEKCAACRTLGARDAVNYRTKDFVEAVTEWTGGRGVDVVLDMVGGPYLEKNIEVMAVEGRLALIATQGGTTGTLPIHRLMMKRGTIVASTLRARTAEEKGEVARRLLTHIWPLLPSKEHIRPLIDREFPLEDAWRAHERLEGGDHIGKIVLLVNQTTE